MPLFIMNSDDKYLAAAAHNDVKKGLINQTHKYQGQIFVLINPVSAYALDSHR